MAIRFITATILAALALAVGAASAEPLRVVTYNVQFLPGIAASHNERPEPEYRARRIAEAMSAFDIVGLQETFHEEHRPILLEALEEAWGGSLNVIVAPKPEGRMANGGCLLATRLPIVEEAAMVFENFSSPEDYGLRADGYAAKGVIFGRLALGADGGAPFADVFVTHLEARADHLRPEQYKEMAAFIKAKAGDGNPVILMGDMNTRGMKEHQDDPDSQYNTLMKALNGIRPEAPFVDLWLALKPNELGGTSEQESADVGKRIDYIFVSNPPAGFRLEPKTVAVNLYQDDKVFALSDHNAVEADLEVVAD